MPATQDSSGYFIGLLTAHSLRQTLARTSHTKDADWTVDPVLRLKGESRLEHDRHFHFRRGIGQRASGTH